MCLKKKTVSQRRIFMSFSLVSFLFKKTSEFPSCLFVFSSQFLIHSFIHSFIQSFIVFSLMLFQFLPFQFLPSHYLSYMFICPSFFHFTILTLLFPFLGIWKLTPLGCISTKRETKQVCITNLLYFHCRAVELKKTCTREAGERMQRRIRIRDEHEYLL